MSEREERKRQMHAAIVRNFETRSAEADAMLSIMRGQTRGERVRLMTFLLLNYRLLMDEPTLPKLPIANGLGDESFAKIQGKIKGSIVQVIRRLLSANEPVEQTATQLLKHFDELASDDERKVALAIVLQSPLAPYAPFDPSLLLGPFVPEQENRKDAVRRSIALAMRAVQETGDPTVLITAWHRIMARHANPYEAQAVLSAIIELVSNNSERAGEERARKSMPDMPTAIVIKGSLADLLRAAASSESCDDSTCAFHGKGEDKDKDKRKPN